YERVSGQSFYTVHAPDKRSPFPTNGSHADFLTEVAKHREAFLEHMEDDFNTGGAVGVLHDLLKTLNRFADDQRMEEAKPAAQTLADFGRGVAVLRELSQILGVFTEPPAKPAAGNDELVSGLMKLLIDLRADARKTKNFAVADQIRKRLAELN